MRNFTTCLVMAALAFGLFNCSPGSNDASGELVLYSGRSKSLVEPIIKMFQEETGIAVKVKYGNTAQLALALKEEGKRSKADVFWAQDAGALGTVSKAGLFAPLPNALLSDVPRIFRHAGGQWVATSGRARVLAYSSERVAAEDLPGSILELTDPKWKGRVGWAPANASFQSFVTALRVGAGEEAAEKWLRAMKANEAKAYPKNTAIIQAIVAREVDLGIPNHYYLLRFKKGDSKFPVEQQFFNAGDVGNLVNVAGAGILHTASNPEAARAFMRFLLDTSTQQYFSSELFEYSVAGKVIANPRLVDREELIRLAPTTELTDLDDLDGTLALLRKVGLL